VVVDLQGGRGALASRDGRWWVGGAAALLAGQAAGGPVAIAPGHGAPIALQIDNHWVLAD
jgi:hypothetical protein